jgi:hypothetical protein
MLVKLRPWIIEVVGWRLYGSRGRIGLIVIGDDLCGWVVDAQLEEPLKKHENITHLTFATFYKIWNHIAYLQRIFGLVFYI